MCRLLSAITTPIRAYEAPRALSAYLFTHTAAAAAPGVDKSPSGGAVVGDAGNVGQDDGDATTRVARE